MKPIEFTDAEGSYLYDVLQNSYALIDPSQSPFNHIHNTIEGKIISKHHALYDQISDMRNNRWHKDNEFNTDPLFLGGGLYSVNRVSIMHKRLAYAVMILGGKQQNGGQGNEFDEQSDKEDEQSIKVALKDIIAAFGYMPTDL